MPRRTTTGLAHVATASFLASRATPTGGFAVALAGGVALARAAERFGARHGFGASLAAMLQTIAIMGPARIQVPLTQAVSAPVLGHMVARGRGRTALLAATFVMRAAQNALSTLFYVAVIVGLEAFTGTYERLFGWVPFLPNDQTGAIIGATFMFLFWAVAASVVQVLVYQRGLENWPADPPAPDVIQAEAADPDAPAPDSGPRPAERGIRFDPRAILLAATVAFAILLTGTWWPMLAAVSAWLVLASLLARGDRSAIKPGLALTGIIAFGALTAGLIGGIGLELTLRRTLRAALLVLVATWLRYAAGEDGLREVFRRLLHRFDRVPSLRETADVLDGLGSTDGLAASGRRLVARLKGVEPDPIPVTDAVLDWVAGEAGRHDPAEHVAHPALRVRGLDALLVALAAACALALPLAA